MFAPGPAAADCHVRLGVDLVRHTWDGVVLTVLRNGPARRRDLLTAIGGVSDKVLHEAIGRLVARRLVERGDADATYQLTPVGRSFTDGPLLGLARWAEEHREALGATDDP